jgi:hypothetical protein
MSEAFNGSADRGRGRVGLKEHRVAWPGLEDEEYDFTESRVHTGSILATARERPLQSFLILHMHFL